MANGWGGRRAGAGRKTGTTTLALLPKISVPELARRYTHNAVRFLAATMEQGYTTRMGVDREGNRIEIHEPASPALRVHCAELLIERGHGKPHQAIAVADGSTENKTLRDLILGAMALPTDSDTLTIDHQPTEDDEDARNPPAETP